MPISEEIEIAEIQVVGFSGSVLADCGRKKALGYWEDRANDKKAEADGLYFSVLDNGTTFKPRYVWHRNEVEAMRAERRMTLLSGPLPAAVDAVVVYVTRDFLQALGLNRPENLPGNFRWQVVEATPADAEAQGAGAALSEIQARRGPWAMCASAKAAETQLDEWASRLLRKATDQMIAYYASTDEAFRQQAEDLTQMALDAACDLPLRAKIYVCFAAAFLSSPAEVHLTNIFNYEISPQFPQWTWDSFKTALQHFIDLLRIKASALTVERKAPVAVAERAKETPELSRPAAANAPSLDAIIQEIDQQVSHIRRGLIPEELVEVAERSDRLGWNRALEDQEFENLAKGIDVVVRLIQRIPDARRRLEVCERVADEFEQIFEIDPTTAMTVTNRISGNSSFLMDKLSLKVMACSLTFFYRPVFTLRPGRQPVLDSWAYLSTADEIPDDTLEKDTVAQWMRRSASTPRRTAMGYGQRNL